MWEWAPTLSQRAGWAAISSILGTKPPQDFVPRAKKASQTILGKKIFKTFFKETAPARTSLRAERNNNEKKPVYCGASA